MTRTGLSPADIAESFRDRCGDGSVEWVYTPMQTWVLLDTADMLDENERLREQIHWLKQGDILHVLTDQEYIDQCERERLMQVSIDALDKENDKLRELMLDMWGFIEGTDEDCGDVTFSSCFDYCKHDTADDGCCKTGECWYEQRMRELGVEP